MYEVALSAGVVVATMIRQRELAIGLSVLLFFLLMQRETSCDRPRNVAAGKATTLYRPKTVGKEGSDSDDTPQAQPEPSSSSTQPHPPQTQPSPDDPSLRSTPNPRHECALSPSPSLSDHHPSVVEAKRDAYLFRPEPLQPTSEQRARQLDNAYDELEARSVMKDPWLKREGCADTLRGRSGHTVSAILG